MLLIHYAKVTVGCLNMTKKLELVKANYTPGFGIASEKI